MTNDEAVLMDFLLERGYTKKRIALVLTLLALKPRYFGKDTEWSFEKSRAHRQKNILYGLADEAKLMGYLSKPKCNHDKKDKCWWCAF
jgi:hypothetical protein